MDDYRVELFIFPDGTAVEMIVFENGASVSGQRTSDQASHGHGSTASQRGSARPAPQGEISARLRTAIPAPPETAKHRAAAEPQHCPVCQSNFVYPVDSERTGADVWELTLRCPNCETRRRITLDRQQVESFNRVLYQGAQLLARQAEQLTRRQFKEEIRRFVSALEHDLILPIDF